ncbi:hypothetical protein CGCA056_v011937 [Colletotrichum aenigma]|uniref:uncharacterized protein n=1 Tax=Colletotrichum aenigma TaxID=1215731 RepID=UPI00187238A9|nr:uncharacterized protein CGCA056_v011937 [Colletotrichum aenigma]KAF5512126.1 hypothetical protein CGCA056_v011937 [Colletotrichum aenigma]
MATTSTRSISELYRSYKKLTNDFLTWLWCQHRLKAPTETDLKFKSTADILKTSQLLQESKAKVPVSVIGSLRKAIKTRKLVADIYQQFGAGHHGHDAFIDRLEEVLSTLTPLVKDNRAPSVDGSNTDDEPSSNRFYHLPTVESELDGEDAPIETGHKHRSSPLSSSYIADPSNESGTPSDFFLEDDYIREVFEAAYFIMELDSVHTLLKKCWMDASRGTLPLPLAAWMTNFAMYTIARRTPPKFVQVCVAMSVSPECTSQFFSQLSDKVDPRSFVSDARRFFMLAQTVNEYGQTLSGEPRPMIQGKNMICHNPGCVCKFNASYEAAFGGSHTAEVGEELSESDKAMVCSIFDIVRADLDTERAIGILEATKPLSCGCFTPICDSFFFTARDYLSQSVLLASSRIAAAFNLYLLTEESITTSEATITRPHYRFKSIRLAIGMRKSVLPVLEAVNEMIPNCDRAKYWQGQLHEFLNALTAYVSEKSFDTYHTSPWVAGSHMMELLNAAFGYGFRINSDWAVISATLHLYNAMRRSVAETPRIPVFEELSRVLIQSIFGGSMPERNFCSTFRRIVYNSKVEKGDVSRGGSKMFRLEAGFVQLPQLMEINSHLLDQHFSNHDNSALFRGDVLGIPYQPALGPKSYYKIRDTQAKLKLSEYMEKAKNTVLLDIEGPQPIARINLFAVFILCSRFLNKLGSLGKPHMPKGIWSSFVSDQLKNDLVVGRCDAEFLMESIDDFSSSKQGRRYLQRTGPIRDAIKAFKEIDPETPLSQCMWDF